jgi:hypothetical protein
VSLVLAPPQEAGFAEPSAAEGLLSALGERVADTLHVPLAALSLRELSHEAQVADAPSTFAVREGASPPRAVLMCSSRDYPDMVERSMVRAARAKQRLPRHEAAAILTPLLQGRVHGMSFALLNYCRPLSRRRPLSWVQRSLLQPHILEWIFRVAESTREEPDDAARAARFAEPLRLLRSMRALSAPVRQSTRRALDRLHDGDWNPKQVLMHGDLWEGNVLIDDPDPQEHRTRWAQRFAVIDWPGSELHGYAIYDLVRYALSSGLAPRRLHGEVTRHCAALACEPEDAMCYLLCALGHIGMHLEEFPFERYVRMVEACYGGLQRAELR